MRSVDGVCEHGDGRRGIVSPLPLSSIVDDGRSFVREVRLDTTGVLASSLVSLYGGTVDGDGVGLEVEDGLEDDELLREAVGVRAEVVVGFVVCFLSA